jgi:hypothetical protein
MHRFRLCDWLFSVVALALVACGGEGSRAGAASTAPDSSVSSDDAGFVGDASLTEGSTVADATSDVGSPDSGNDTGADTDAQSSFVMASHPPWPQIPLMSNPGATFQTMKLVSIVVQGDPLANMLFGFGDALVKSAWWTTVGKDYSLGPTAMTNVHVTGPPIPQNTTRADPKNPGSADMANYIQNLINTNVAPARDDNAMYLLYLPPGIAAFDDKSSTSNTYCQFYGGYHGAQPYVAADGGATNNVFIWGYAQRCGPTASPSDLDTLTLAASHEIAEAATDALPGYGWTFLAAIPTTPPPAPWTKSPWVPLGGEVGDLCESTQWTEGTYKYQRIWSNTAAGGPDDPCVPAYSNVPYVNASAPQTWYSVSAGASVQIPVTGFSDRATADWYLYPVKMLGNDSGSRLTSQITSSTTVQTSRGATATTNNGRNATLTVSAASGTPSGTWTLIEVTSQPQSPNGGDPSHFWLLGVYVP